MESLLVLHLSEIKVNRKWIVVVEIDAQKEWPVWNLPRGAEYGAAICSEALIII
jgi:hypothetical protein